MSEEQYATWAFQQDFESEWVNGEVIIMPPIGDDHDGLQWWLRSVLQGYADRRDLGQAKGPEFQIRLPTPSRREPEVLFVTKARLPLIQRTYLDGPPDVAIEIISPESQTRDRREKYIEYQAAGVREYWIIDPAAEGLDAYALGSNHLYAPLLEVGGKVSSTVLPGWYLRASWLFHKPRISFLDALSELGIR